MNQPAGIAKWRQKVIDNPFAPKFQRVGSLLECADMINKPHEDYPVRVGWTLVAINRLCAYLATENVALDWSDAEASHWYMWRDCNPKRILVGDSRRIDVQVNGNTCPPAWVVPHLLDMAFPVLATNEAGLIEWYRVFQSIHPFEDGNGRVGGVMVAALSYKNWGYYLAPLQ